jgi:hypothetical protein
MNHKKLYLSGLVLAIALVGVPTAAMADASGAPNQPAGPVTQGPTIPAGPVVTVPGWDAPGPFPRTVAISSITDPIVYNCAAHTYTDTWTNVAGTETILSPTTYQISAQTTTYVINTHPVNDTSYATVCPTTPAAAAVVAPPAPVTKSLVAPSKGIVKPTTPAVAPAAAPVVTKSTILSTLALYRL